MIDVVVLFGVIGSGKTFEQNKYKGLGFIGMEFANPLKQIASEITGVDAFAEEFKDARGRAMLQNLGSSIRKIDDNFFAKCLAERVKKLPPKTSVVISDARYINEVSALLHLTNDAVVVAKGGVRVTGILCNYKSDRYDATNQHESEELAQRMLAKFNPTGDYLRLSQQDLIDLVSGW